MTEKRPDANELFLAALRIAGDAERQLFLDLSCRQDPDLRREVEERLRRHGVTAGAASASDPSLATQISEVPDAPPLTAVQSGVSSLPDHTPSPEAGPAKLSVLTSLGDTLNEVPRVALREPSREGIGPVLHPKSPQIPDRTADGRYALLGEIARGGMGAILKGRDNDLGRELAIKVLLDAHKGKPHVIQRFIEEAQIGGQLQHPGIAPVYELGQFVDSRPFFSMKLVKGETLAALLARRETPATDRGRFLGIYQQICQTMAYVHSRGVIHRDLKPANVMVGAFGEVQVMDWGLAKVLSEGGAALASRPAEIQNPSSVIHTRRNTGSDSGGSSGPHTQMGSVLGTPAYMPPEQALGEIDQLDQRSDVFGLGAILCEILTGSPPYVHADSQQVFRLASRGKLEECFERLATCGADTELVELTRHCLQAEPDQRPADAGVLATRVSTYLQTVESKLRETELARVAQAARLEQQQTAARKQRRLTGVLAGVALIAGLAFAMAQIARREADFHAQRATEAALEARENLTTAQTAQQQTAQALAVVAEQKSKVERQEAKGRQLLYATDMQLLPLQWENPQFTSQQLLDRLTTHDPVRQPAESVRADQRGFEWFHYRHRLTRESTLLRDQGNPLVDLAFPGEQEVVALDTSHQATRWEVTRPASQPAFPGATALPNIRLGAVSPRGTQLALLAGDEVRLFDHERGELPFRLTPARITTSLLYSADGRILLTYNDVLAEWFDTATGQRIAAQEVGNQALSAGRGLSLSADGRTLAVWGQGPVGQLIFIHRVDPAAQTVVSATDPINFTGTMAAAELSPDGKRVAVGAHFGGGVAVYDVETGTPLGEHRSAHAAPIAAVRFTPDGARLVTADVEGTIKLWGSPDTLTSDHSPVRTLRGHTGTIQHLAFSPDSRRLASSGTDRSLRVWLLDEVPSPYQLLSERGVDPQYFADGLLIAAGEGNHVTVWDASTLQPVRRLAEEPGRILSVAISPDARLLAVGRNRTRIGRGSYASLWDLQTGEKRAEFDGFDDTRLVETAYSRLEALAFSPDGRFLVGGFGARESHFINTPVPLKVWDVASRREWKQLDGHGNACVALEFSGDGKWLASGSHDGTVRLWDTSSWEPLGEPLDTGEESVESLAISPDGQSMAVGTMSRSRRSGELQLWDLQTRGVTTWPRAHSAAIECIAFSPDGRTVATGSDDETIRLWNVDSAKEMLILNAPGPDLPKPRSVRFAPVGHQLLAASPGTGGLVAWSGEPSVWEHPTRRVGRLQRLLDSEADFAVVIRMLSGNPGVRQALDEIETTDRRVLAARAALRGDEHAARGEWAEAVGELERLSTLDEGGAQRWLRVAGVARLARALCEVGRPVEGAALLAGITPDRKRQDFDSGDWCDDFLEVVSERLQRQPGDPALNELRAELLGHAQQPEQQLAAYSAAIEQLGEVPARETESWARLRRRRGRVSLEQKRWREALADYDALITDTTVDGTLLSERAQAREGLGDWEGAAADGVRAAGIRPDGGHWLDGLARRMAAAGELPRSLSIAERAREQYEQRLQTDPENRGLVEGLADLLLDLTDQWSVVHPTEVRSTQGTSFSLLPDGSFLAGGPVPETDDYRLTFSVEVPRVTAIRLEALTDPSLPNGGPGRYETGLFVMDRSEIRIPAEGPFDGWNRVRIQAVYSDFYSGSQPIHPGSGKWHIAGGQGKSHVLIYRPAEPVLREEVSQLTLRMLFNHHPMWRRLNLGRFRWSVSADPEAFERETLRIEARKLSDPWEKLLIASHLRGDQPLGERVLARRPMAATALKEAQAQATRVSRGELISPAMMVKSEEGAATLLREAARLLWLGHHELYLEHCAVALDSVGETRNPILAERISKMCCLSPRQPAEWQATVIPLARRTRELGAFHQYKHYFQMLVGMALYRGGEFAEADRELLKAVEMGRGDSTVAGTTGLYRAMCLFRLGREDEARRVLVEAADHRPTERIDESQNPTLEGVHENHLIYWLAYREACELLGIDPVAGQTGK